MNNVLALVLAGGRVDELSVLTLSRPKSAVPFGGQYRVIDFSLSNLMHSGIEKVGIISQYRSYSLLNHIGIGSWWDFVGRDRGATMLLPSPDHLDSAWFKGTADAVFQNLEFIKEQDPELVLILSGDHVYRMDYAPMINFHRGMNADLTIACIEIDPSQGNRFGMAAIQSELEPFGGPVMEYLEKPADSKLSWASLTIYLFRPKVLYKVLRENAASSNSFEFGRDIIPKMLGRFQVYGYKFDGYWGYTRTLDEYWQTSMELLSEDSPLDLAAWEIRTNLDHDHLRDRPPAWVSPTAHISNSFVHKGCQIAGKVENSILFPGVQVAENAVVKDSILFFDTIVKTGARVDRVIADFDVSVGENSCIGRGLATPANLKFPKLLTSGLTIIGKGTSIPPDYTFGRNIVIAPGLSESHFKQKTYKTGSTIE